MIQIKKETAYIDGYLTPYIESINANTIDRSIMIRFNSTYSRTVCSNGIVRKVTYANKIRNNML